MMRKPLPKDAARLVRERLATKNIVITSRQSLDLVAVVEGYPTWQAFKGALDKKTSEPTPMLPDEASAYDKAWAVVSVAIEAHMTKMRRVLLEVMNYKWKDAGFTLHEPLLDVDADEYSGFMWLETPEGHSRLTITISLVEDEDGAGYSLRFELYAPQSDEMLSSLLATPRVGVDCWVPFEDIDSLAKMVEEFYPYDVAQVILSHQYPVG